MVGQGTFGKVYLVMFALTAGEGQEGRAAVGAQGGAPGPQVQEPRAEHHRAHRAQQHRHHEGVLPQVSPRRNSAPTQECYLSMIMDYIPSSLNLLIKEQRKAKKPFAPVPRKLMVFQLFKALYYMQVLRCSSSSPRSATATSSRPTSWSTTRPMS